MDLHVLVCRVSCRVFIPFSSLEQLRFCILREGVRNLGRTILRIWAEYGWLGRVAGGFLGSDNWLMMSQQRIPVRRGLVGLLSLLCLGTGVFLWVQNSGSADSRSMPIMWAAAFGRVGLLLGAFWIAMPTKDREAAWANVSVSTLAGAALALFAIARYPRTALPLLAVIAVIGYFVKPKQKYRPPRD